MFAGTRVAPGQPPSRGATSAWVNATAATPPPWAPRAPQRLCVAQGGQPGLRATADFAPAHAVSVEWARWLLAVGGTCARAVELTGLTLSCLPPAIYPFNPEVRVAAFDGAAQFSSAHFMRLTGPIVMDFDRRQAFPPGAPLRFPLPSLPVGGNVLVTLCNVTTSALPVLKFRTAFHKATGRALALSWPPTTRGVFRFWVHTDALKPPAAAGGDATLVRSA